MILPKSRNGTRTSQAIVEVLEDLRHEREGMQRSADAITKKTEDAKRATRKYRERKEIEEGKQDN